MIDLNEILLRMSILEEKINVLLQKMEGPDENESIGDWITEKVAMRMTGLSRSTLYRLREECLIKSSSLASKKVFYSKKDMSKLLDKNAMKK